MLELIDLMARYRQATPKDKYSSARDATIVMLMAPHLFLGVFDRHWYGLGEAGRFEEAIEDRDELSEPNADEDVMPTRPDEEGLRALLRQILIDQGPLRFADLRDRAASRMRGKSAHSIGPTLLTSGEFVRPLPGIYAVPEQIPAAAAILAGGGTGPLSGGGSLRR